MKELSKEEIQNVNGGITFGLVLGVVGGLIGIYELGKALGRRMK